MYLLAPYGIVFVIAWVYTLVFTSDVENWIIENILTVLFLGVLAVTYRRFQFSDMSYALIFVFMILHIFGAQHTYADAPVGFWIRDIIGLERNPYDRIVHFSFGFLLAYPMRDYFINKMEWPSWVCWVLPIEITLSFSGAYEIIEYAVADIFFPGVGIAYLGTQGDVWDAQKDMLIALTGSVMCMSGTGLMRRLHPYIHAGEQ